MARLSAERVSKELLKLLAAPDPRDAVAAMAETGVLARVLPEAGDRAVFERLCDMSGDPLLRLAALIGVGADAGATARRLRLSNAQRARLAAATGEAGSTSLNDVEARAALYRLGRQTFEDRIRLAQAAGAGDAEGGERLLRLAADWTPPTMPVGGAELKALGVPPGPLTGQALKAFETRWIAEDFPDAGHENRLKAILADLSARG